jgi:hypothetical protein
VAERSLILTLRVPVGGHYVGTGLSKLRAFLIVIGPGDANVEYTRRHRCATQVSPGRELPPRQWPKVLDISAGRPLYSWVSSAILCPLHRQCAAVLLSKAGIPAAGLAGHTFWLVARH